MAVIFKNLAFTGDAPTAHTLDSHSTRAHSELSDAPEGAHHTKFTTTEHSAIGNGAPHHTKYTNSEAKAASVLAGAITNAETKAPTHDAVYDVKVTAEAAQTAAEVDADILTHKNIATAHHTKYTDANARAAAVSDAIYGAGWNGVTTIAPSKNAVYDKIETLGAGGDTIVWLASSVRVLSDNNRTAFLNWTDLDLTGDTSANAKFAIVSIEGTIDSISVGAHYTIELRKNGDTPTYHIQFRGDGTEIGFPSRRFEQCIVPLDSGQIFEYKLNLSGTIQFDSRIYLLGYIE